MHAMPNSNYLTPSLSEIEQNLAPVISKIDREKRKKLSKFHLIKPTACVLWQKAKKSPWKTISTVALGLLPLIVVHPVVVGTSACLNAYRLDDWTHVYSANKEVATNATGLYSDLGHAVGYVIEGIAMSILSAKILFEPSYDQALFETIESIFDPEIKNAERTVKEQNFLYKLKMRELNYYKLPSFIPSASNKANETLNENLAASAKKIDESYSEENLCQQV